MDPNNNQPINQPIINQQQSTAAPQVPVETVAQQGMQYQNPNMHKGSKAILILIILLILVIGLTSYLIFVNMKSNTPQNLPVSNVQVTPPTPTSTPTPLAEDDLTVEDPEVDIKALDDAALGL